MQGGVVNIALFGKKCQCFHVGGRHAGIDGKRLVMEL